MARRLISIAFFIHLCSVQLWAEQIYMVRGARGVVTFTSRKPSEGASYKILNPHAATFSMMIRRRGKKSWKTSAITSEFDNMIEAASEQRNLETALVKAVVHAESLFNPKARSNKGAMGLMQLMPGTAKRFGVKNAYLPEQNVSAGTKYLRFLLDRYIGNERLAIAAYNAGEGAVDEIRGIPPYSETQTYVKRVLKLRDLYRCAESREGSGKKGCSNSIYLE